MRLSPELAGEIDTKKKYLKRLQESFYKYKDWNTTGSHYKKLKEIREKINKTKEEIKKLKEKSAVVLSPELARFHKLIAEKTYNPQLNQIKDRMERIRYQMKNKKGDARKPDQEQLHKLQVDKDRLQRVTETK